MHELDRRSMLKVVAALSLGPHSALADEKESTLHFVEAGTDRTGQPHKVARANSHLDFKVLTHETNSALFIMENRNMVRGNPRDTFTTSRRNGSTSSKVATKY